MRLACAALLLSSLCSEPVQLYVTVTGTPPAEVLVLHENGEEEALGKTPVVRHPVVVGDTIRIEHKRRAREEKINFARPGEEKHIQYAF